MTFLARVRDAYATLDCYQFVCKLHSVCFAVGCGSLGGNSLFFLCLCAYCRLAGPTSRCRWCRCSRWLHSWRWLFFLFHFYLLQRLFTFDVHTGAQHCMCVCVYILKRSSSRVHYPLRPYGTGLDGFWRSQCGLDIRSSSRGISCSNGFTSISAFTGFTNRHWRFGRANRDLQTSPGANVVAHVLRIQFAFDAKLHWRGPELHFALCFCREYAVGLQSIHFGVYQTFMKRWNCSLVLASNPATQVTVRMFCVTGI